MTDENFTDLLKKINIKFKDIQLLQTAFTHRSFLNEIKQKTESNERLEFLGDSVLSFIISSYLYKLRPFDSEGNLTNLRSYIVKTSSLAAASQKLNLGSYLRMSKGEELSGGRTNTQLLANTFEALLGAVYLDCGIEEARRLVEETLLPSFSEALRAGPPKDAKSELQEVVQEKIRQSPHYKILESRGPDHAKRFTVGVFVEGKKIGEGSGNSKQVAEEEAARQALERFTK